MDSLLEPETEQLAVPKWQCRSQAGCLIATRLVSDSGAGTEVSGGPYPN